MHLGSGGSRGISDNNDGDNGGGETSGNKRQSDGEPSRGGGVNDNNDEDDDSGRDERGDGTRKGPRPSMRVSSGRAGAGAGARRRPPRRRSWCAKTMSSGSTRMCGCDGQ